jgi:RHS repeat-associated protein
VTTSTATIQRKTYALGGTAVAMRASGYPAGETGKNGLFYMHSDHLGSNSVMSYGQGHPSNLVGKEFPNSRGRYFPYGGWRVTPTAGLTDQGYTGHRHNNIGTGGDDLGLIFMQARYYLPGAGRFISADTIVPDPTNPQQFNRYTYVLNNPLRFTDPTGHLSEDEIKKYFGYTTKQQMIDAYGQAVADGLWNTDFTWGDVLSYSCEECNGGRGYAMLLLLQISTGLEKFRGAFWGIEATHHGIDYTGVEINMGIKPEFADKSVSKTEYYRNNYGAIPVNRDAYGMGHQGSDMLAGSWYNAAFWRPVAFVGSLAAPGWGRAWQAYDVIDEYFDDILPFGHPLGDYLTVYPTIRQVNSLHPHGPNTYSFLAPRGIR